MMPGSVFVGKSFAVMGLARTGLSVVEFLRANGASVVAWDDMDELRERAEVRVRIENPREMDLTQFDGIVMSPGIPLNWHPVAEKAQVTGIPLIGDIELFAQIRPELPPHKVVGVTGTNGKSTTSALIHHILKTAGIPAMLGGNIGVPVLGEEPLPEDGVYVLELSSFQIDLTYTLDCDVAVLLNISPDHLERYGSFEDYAMSKARLFVMQSPGHLAIVSLDDDYSRKIADLVASRKVTFSAGGCMDQSAWPALQGPHNAQNVIAARAAARELGVDEATIEQGLRSFPGLPHRMERVADRDGVLYVNDSKATNPTSSAPALGAYPKIHWILGGRSKTDDLDACKPYFDHVIAAYAIGESAGMYEELLRPFMPVRNCRTLREAVKLAAIAARPGETVLLSPACASFDQFRSFEERGDEFRAVVRGL